MKYNRKRKSRRHVKLTVCVATINNNNTITGASDRMITASDIQYQPNAPKIWFFTNSIAALVAADIQTQKVIFDNVFDIIYEKIALNPSIWIKVKDVAALYVNQYIDIKNQAIQRKILSPFGLTHESFIAKQMNMSSSFVSEISKKISEFDFPDVETLLVGCDEGGPHIFSVENEEITCDDSIGFAAIGIGKYHAESHLMFNGYSPNTDSLRALLYTHRAKKIAETAPGVGSATDMVVIGPRLGFHWLLPQSFIDSLDVFYDQYKEEIKITDNKNFEKLAPFIREYAEQPFPKEIQQRMAQSWSGKQPIKSITSPISHK